MYSSIHTQLYSRQNALHLLIVPWVSFPCFYLRDWRKKKIANISLWDASRKRRKRRSSSWVIIPKVNLWNKTFCYYVHSIRWSMIHVCVRVWFLYIYVHVYNECTFPLYSLVPKLFLRAFWCLHFSLGEFSAVPYRFSILRTGNAYSRKVRILNINFKSLKKYTFTK